MWGGELNQVVPEYRDVDIFRDALDQAVSLPERGTALDKKARPHGRHPVVQRVGGQAHS